MYKKIIVLLVTVLFVACNTSKYGGLTIGDDFMQMEKPIRMDVVFFEDGRIQSMSIKGNMEKSNLQDRQIQPIPSEYKFMSMIIQFLQDGQINSMFIEDNAGKKMVVNFSLDGIESFSITDNNNYEVVSNINTGEEQSVQRYEQIGDIHITYEISKTGEIKVID